MVPNFSCELEWITSYGLQFLFCVALLRQEIPCGLPAFFSEFLGIFKVLLQLPGHVGYLERCSFHAAELLWPC